MKKKFIFSTVWPIIKSRKLLRTLSLLNVLFIFLIAIFFFVSGSHGKKIEMYKEEISKNEQLLKSLQQLAMSKGAGDAGNNLFSNKSFAEYDEVIPFVAYVEGLLSEADPAAEVSIKSNEDQIFIDHFADYLVNLKIKNKEAFFAAMDELHTSKFVVKLLNFSMNYKPREERGNNEFSEAEFSLRLYLK